LAESPPPQPHRPTQNSPNPKTHKYLGMAEILEEMP
jgi:hypothetical protein